LEASSKAFSLRSPIDNDFPFTESMICFALAIYWESFICSLHKQVYAYFIADHSLYKKLKKRKRSFAKGNVMHLLLRFIALGLFLFSPVCISAQVSLGVDNLFQEKYLNVLKNKRVGLITNHTAINCHMDSTINILKTASAQHQFKLTAL